MEVVLPLATKKQHRHKLHAVCLIQSRSCTGPQLVQIRTFQQTLSQEVITLVCLFLSIASLEEATVRALITFPVVFSIAFITLEKAPILLPLSL